MRLIRLTFKFEEQQRLVVRLYDTEESDPDAKVARMVPQDADFIGEVQCLIAQIMGARGCLVTMKIVNSVHPSRAKGSITLHAEEVKNSNALVRLQITGERLDRKVRGFVLQRGTATWFPNAGM